MSTTETLDYISPITETLITCPAPLEMLRRGSPVIAGRTDGLASDEPLRGVVVGPFGGPVDAPTWDVAWADYLPLDTPIRGETVTRGRTLDMMPKEMRMDLTDATGRTHAAWWAGDAHEAATFPPNCGRPTFVATEGGWMLSTDGHDFVFWSAHSKMFAHLNPTDDTRLPDGSRVVDALALKAVVEHLLSQQDPHRLCLAAPCEACRHFRDVGGAP